MEFGCSHVVCNWTSARAESAAPAVPIKYDNRMTVQQPGAPPPPPPRRLKKPRPSEPPPVPPRARRQEAAGQWSNINVVSLSVGDLVDISRASVEPTYHRPVFCGKCSAAWSSLTTIQNNLWVCDFCGCGNRADPAVTTRWVSGSDGESSDELYLLDNSQDDYQNLEDSLLVFCVDVSGSMSVTAEVSSSSGPQHVSRLEGIQEALQRALLSVLQQSPHRRVALVTFSDEVVIYGDGRGSPVTLNDWALIDYDHIWAQGVAYNVPHCIAETYDQLIQRVKNLKEHGATCLGAAAVASVAMASRYLGSKVILCTDGRANIGLGQVEQLQSNSLLSPHETNFYRQLSAQAVDRGVIVSVMTFEGTDCCLAHIGRLADVTGGRVIIVNIGTIATEIQLASTDNVLAMGVKATLIAPEGMYFPFEDENNHKLVKQIGNVTRGVEITAQFAVRAAYMEIFLQKSRVQFQLQLSFTTREQQSVTRVITELRPVTDSSCLWQSSFNCSVLAVHCAQLCARLTMEGRVQEAQSQLRAQQQLLSLISRLKPGLHHLQHHHHYEDHQEENTYGNCIDTMTTICDHISSDSQTLSDEAALVVYQMKRVSSLNINNTNAAIY
ncbi:circularly permutated Ras protein 1 [Cynoglossus semilaevis]|uniref:circularly permutated Ras protein 1 n=1 Tax=Cynoglossus semilaevis TaxID=244447 RepID=UPI000495CD64|nr:circularly permutated Ras protein 1-like [Cynoglossus semilaevis]